MEMIAGKFRAEISREEVNKLDLFAYDGEVVLLEDKKTLKAYMPELYKSDLVGFDTESKPSFVKGIVNEVALVQIALADKVVLIRLNKTGPQKELFNWLNDDAILKIGIGLDDDIQRLSRFSPVSATSFFDLNSWCSELGFKNTGARNLSAMILGKRISKSKQLSNWQAQELNEGQIRYAATDAWICREIFLKLKENGM